MRGEAPSKAVLMAQSSVRFYTVQGNLINFSIFATNRPTTIKKAVGVQEQRMRTKLTIRRDEAS